MDNRFLLTAIIFLGIFSSFSVVSEENIRDPSIPLSILKKQSKAPVKVYAKKTYELSSIFIGNEVRVVVINDHAYREGDKLGKYRIKKINHSSVLMVADGQSRLLKLYPVDKSGFTMK